MKHPSVPMRWCCWDCGAPKCAPAVRAALVDVLSEACAGTLKSLLETGRATHLPLSPSGQGEFSGHDAQALPSAHASRRRRRWLQRNDRFFTRALARVAAHAAHRLDCHPDHAADARRGGRCHRAFAHGLQNALYPRHRGRTEREEAQLLHLLFASGLETAHIRAA